MLPSLFGCRDEDSGTEAGISVVIAVLNIVLKLFVQVLAAAEKQWTRSEMVRMRALIYPGAPPCCCCMLKNASAAPH
eukprot:1154090-Pelagomonas_calceolata.AAC.8